MTLQRMQINDTSNLGVEGENVTNFVMKYTKIMPDGGGRRLCSKVWQLALVAGVRFVEKQTAVEDDCSRR